MDVDEICRRNPSPLAAGQPCEQRSSSRKRCYRASTLTSAAESASSTDHLPRCSASSVASTRDIEVSILARMLWFSKQAAPFHPDGLLERPVPRKPNGA